MLKLNKKIRWKKMMVVKVEEYEEREDNNEVED